jgi:hypothetical protein
VHDERDLCGLGRSVVLDFYNVRMNVWKGAGLDSDDEVHIDCLPERLGRPLEISDFDPDASINRMLFYGYRMGRRPTEAGEIPPMPPNIEKQSR